MQRIREGLGESLTSGQHRPYLLCNRTTTVAMVFSSVSGFPPLMS
jgi:hypothetical protein